MQNVIKKYTGILICFVLCFSLSACGVVYSKIGKYNKMSSLKGEYFNNKGIPRRTEIRTIYYDTVINNNNEIMILYTPIGFKEGEKPFEYITNTKNNKTVNIKNDKKLIKEINTYSSFRNEMGLVKLIHTEPCYNGCYYSSNVNELCKSGEVKLPLYYHWMECVDFKSEKYNLTGILNSNDFKKNIFEYPPDIVYLLLGKSFIDKIEISNTETFNTFYEYVTKTKLTDYVNIKNVIDERLVYRKSFEDAKSSKELNEFINKYKNKDPDLFVDLARKKFDLALLGEYRALFSNAKSQEEFRQFIKNCEKYDPDNLLPQAKIKLSEVVKREYREEFNKAYTSVDFTIFINKNKSADYDNLIPNAQIKKSEALQREKSEYASAINKNWSSDFKVKVTYTTAPGKAMETLQKVKDAMKVRDPWGIMNPYWVPNFHVAAAYDDKGIVVGEWYTNYYEGWNAWGNNFEREIKALNLSGHQVTPMGRTAATASRSSSAKSGNKNMCYSISDKDTLYSCLAQFEGKNTCYSIRDKDTMYACQAQFEGKNTCYSIRDDDTRYACLAQSEGKSTCYSIRDDDARYACLAQFEGKNTCYSIRDKDTMYACQSQFE